MSEEVSPLPRSRAALRQTWIERLERFANSQLSVVAFCRAEGISAHSFYYWKRQLTNPAPTADNAPPRLLPVRLLPATTPVEVALPTGAVLRLAPGCDLDFVRALAQTLGSVSC
jgi:transposase-like protein